MKRIKVLQIVPMLGPGGAERVVVHIARGLNRQRYEVAVLSIWQRVGSDLEQMLDNSDVQVSYLGKSWGFDGRIYRRLHQVLKNYAPDIIHTHLHVLRYALPSILLVKRAACLHTVHNQAEREIEPRGRCIQRYALTHGVVPVAVSKDVGNTLEECYGVHCRHIIQNGIPTADYAAPRVSRREWRAAQGFRDADVLFTCVARLAAQKNQALLLEAFSRGPGGDPRAQLVLIGEGDLREQLTEQAKSLGLGGRVHFLGVRTDIADALNAMDVFVLSSDWEGNPLSVMEAMSSGLPVISTAVGGVPDLLTSGKEGLLVQQKDAEGLAKAMTGLLSSAETRRAMGFAAKDRARQNFDVSTMIQAYERLYEELLNLNRFSRMKAVQLISQPDLTLREA